MARTKCVCMALLTLIATGAAAQSREAWLMQNYRFTGPPAPGSIPPVDPVVADLKQIQGTLMSIMRKADFFEDYETAIVAASQAAANAQVIGLIGERLQAAAAARTGAEQSRADVPVYSIAFKDHSVESAIAYWSDGMMLHYITPHGSHVQVRLELVDRDVSARINRAKNLEFNLPQ
jgi:hypothetical protein